MSSKLKELLETLTDVAEDLQEREDREERIKKAAGADEILAMSAELNTIYPGKPSLVEDFIITCMNGLPDKLMQVDAVARILPQSLGELAYMCAIGRFKAIIMTLEEHKAALGKANDKKEDKTKAEKVRG